MTGWRHRVSWGQPVILHDLRYKGVRNQHNYFFTREEWGATMNKTFDRYASLAFFVIGIVFMFESNKISESAYGSEVGPNVFPFLLGLLLGLLSIKLFLETLKYQSKQERKKSLDYKRFLIIFLTAVLYALTLESLGYVLSTFLFLLIGFQTMQRGALLKSVVISSVFSYGVYYLFSEVLKGTLPGFPVWFS